MGAGLASYCDPFPLGLADQFDRPGGGDMGDVDLAEVKKKFGDKLCLMGNLHTTEVMLQGSAQDVEKACRKAIDDAGMDGGFILSTGDQCGRDTPDENIFKMVEVARTYGKY